MVLTDESLVDTLCDRYLFFQPKSHYDNPGLSVHELAFTLLWPRKDAQELFIAERTGR
jgi:hypothetical protein